MDKNKIVVDGIIIEIPRERLEDMETLEAMSDIQEGNALKIVPLFRRIFGDDYKRIKAELKGDSEILSVETMTNWFTKAMEALNAKN